MMDAVTGRRGEAMFQRHRVDPPDAPGTKVSLAPSVKNSGAPFRSRYERRRDKKRCRERRHTGQGEGVGAGTGGHRERGQIALEDLGQGRLGGAGVMVIAVGHGAMVIGRDQGGEHLGAAPVELSLAKFTGEGDMGKNFQKK